MFWACAFYQLSMYLGRPSILWYVCENFIIFNKFQSRILICNDFLSHLLTQLPNANANSNSNFFISFFQLRNPPENQHLKKREITKVHIVPRWSGRAMPGNITPRIRMTRTVKGSQRYFEVTYIQLEKKLWSNMLCKK